MNDRLEIASRLMATLYAESSESEGIEITMCDSVLRSADRLIKREIQTRNDKRTPIVPRKG